MLVKRDGNIITLIWNDHKKQTFSNFLTLARMIILTPLILWSLVSGHHLLAGIVFISAAVTDYLDGHLARKWKQVSVTGELLDPIADKILVLVPLVALINHGIVWWAVVIIFLREFVVSAGRLYANGREDLQKAIKVNFLGKAKTTAQYIAITYAIFNMPYKNEAIILVAIITAISGIQYSIRFVLEIKRIN
ncbi:MAG: CDP-diacylglycerol--glycerol-3-phosphate 3-phosphatidyltransferase [Patescibacteria group bacterium]